VDNDLIGKHLAAGTRYYGQIYRVGIIHGYAILPYGAFSVKDAKNFGPPPLNSPEW
jgi:hypothetical protein